MQLRRALGEGTWVAVGQAVGVLGALFGVRLLTSVLTPAEYGRLALGMTLAMLASQLVVGPLANAVLRFYAPAVEQRRLSGYLVAVRKLAARAGVIILGPAVVVATGVFLTGRSEAALIIALSAAFSLISGASTLISSIQSGARQRAIVAFHQGMEPWARFVLATALVVSFWPSSNLALAGFCGGAALMLVSQSVFLRRLLPREANAQGEHEWREALTSYALPFATWGLFTWCQLASDRWALDWFASRDDVGVYTALYQIGYVPIQLGTAMAIQLLQPILFSRAGDATDATRTREVRRLTKRLAVIALVLSATIFVAALMLHPLVFELLVAAEYRRASPMLPWMALSGGVFAAAQTLTLDLLGRLQPRAMITAKIATALLGVAFSFLGASIAGTMGVVVANLAFSASFFAWMVYLFKNTEHA